MKKVLLTGLMMVFVYLPVQSKAANRPNFSSLESIMSALDRCYIAGYKYGFINNIESGYNASKGVVANTDQLKDYSVESADKARIQCNNSEENISSYVDGFKNGVRDGYTRGVAIGKRWQN